MEIELAGKHFEGIFLCAFFVDDAFERLKRDRRDLGPSFFAERRAASDATVVSRSAASDRILGALLQRRNGFRRGRRDLLFVVVFSLFCGDRRSRRRA
jgi:hypothetical protein